MGREALDREGAGDADAVPVNVRLVVKVLELGLGSDRGIDLLLAGDARLPPAGVRVLCRNGPFGIGLAWDLPLFPRFAERPVERDSQGFQGLLPSLPNDVDFGVVSNGLQSNVRNALVYEAVADVAARRRSLGRSAYDLGFLALALWTVGEKIIWITRSHQTRAGERDSDARCINGDPAPAPLLSDVGGSAGAAGWIQHEVARIGCHQDAAFNHFWRCLNYINSVCPESANLGIGPDI